ncbi:MAG: 4Fe-4S binding protein [Firmicutes bacterium]|nr:4Fe-4S binding protein [Bacillota bacterium]
MKELLIISGKGGTGKTTIVGAFARLAKDSFPDEVIVLADCDVDAADLHLILNPKIKTTNEFFGLKKAVIDENKCDNCGECIKVCRFNAINVHEEQTKIDPISCEGCTVCFHICPKQAISMEDVIAGHWFVSDTAYGPLVHARLGVAEENSGLLVTEVRREARQIAETLDSRLIINDGPPGIGCPVISSISGVDLALIVTEPTIAGIHDMERLYALAKGFDVKTVVCINKYDLDDKTSDNIEGFCKANNIDVVGKIPFDKKVVESLVKGGLMIPPGCADHDAEGPAANAVRQLWTKTLNHLL